MDAAALIAEVRDLAKIPLFAAFVRFAEAGPDAALIRSLPPPIAKAVEEAMGRGGPLLEAMADESVIAAAREYQTAEMDAELAAHEAVVAVMNMVGQCPHCRQEAMLAAFAPITTEAWAAMSATPPAS